MTNTYTHLTPAFRFTPDKLMEMVPNVGSIIDLTATDKYYNPALFTTRGIRHTKIGCGGRGTIPFEAIVHRFFDVVDAFLLSAHSQGKVLMVHCTHVKLNKQHTKKLNMNFNKLVKLFQVIKLKV
ncbi:probable tyrosine-protein phosphatase F54C8.4 isoform X1 [Daphnia pulicaria]|uniref:probable tyrosine-protein phosphatase F54C8.4 isoform X1 n=2 Tax=Daphnia pulicaria TaxID=35523 RepID=UPI001EECEF44|nr:probable tyrosine-protein phosphatase F54C8.4 isoform X1 [Daphnia pulicaria]